MLNSEPRTVPQFVIKHFRSKGNIARMKKKKNLQLPVRFFFSSRRRHTRWTGDWSSDVCSSDLAPPPRELYPLLRKSQIEGRATELSLAKARISGICENSRSRLLVHGCGFRFISSSCFRVCAHRASMWRLPALSLIERINQPSF